MLSGHYLLDLQWTLPADAELTRITIWSHAFTFDSEGERLGW